MTIAVQLALIALSVGGLLAAMAGVHMLAQRYALSAELQRKCVHVATGLYALTLPLTFSETWPVLLLAAVSVAVMLAMRSPALAGSRIASTIHSVERKSYGEILLAIAVGFTFFRSTGNPVLFILPIAVLTFADAAAALTGVRYGRRLFTVEDGTKSIEGVVMFFLVTFIIAMIALLVLTDVPRVSVIFLALIVAGFGAQLEAESWRGLDNLFVPVGLHLFLAANLATPPAALFAQAAVLIALIFAAYKLAPKLGLTPHAARGYVVLAFLILSVTAPRNALLPLAAFVAFIALNRIRSCRSDYPELDLLASFAGIAALWLFLGEWSGHNAINLYNLTFAGVSAVFTVLALPGRLPFAIAVAALLGLAVHAIAPYNAADAQWVQPFAPWIAAALTLCVAAAQLWPPLFDRYRALRACGIAFIVPMLAFGVRSLAS